MIIKGGSRSGPNQLAAHLRRTDTNERVSVLELDSPLGDLREALRDWQVLAGGTRGTKGLYHANIDPDGKYAMTREQWKRCVDVLEEELGFQGQPRAVVMHEKHGRQHIHVVWQRTHVETMTLMQDSWTYPKHERASYRLEEEFGHEHVPGKHVKRNREKQPELPKSEYSHSEAQQAERTGIDPRERKEQVTAIYESCDNGQSLKAALAEEGYVLAKGDRRDFVIVDEAGEIHSLARQIKGVKAKDLREFMADIDRDRLPDTEQAKAVQENIAKQQESERKPEPQKEPQPSKADALREKSYETLAQEAEQQARLAESARVREDAARRAEDEFKAKQTAVVVEDVQKRKAVEEAVTLRAAAERKKLADNYANEREQLSHVLSIELFEKLKVQDQQHRHQREQLAAKLRAEREAREGILNKIDKIIRPKRAKQFEDDRKARTLALKVRQGIARHGLIVGLEREKKAELDTLEERHAQRLRDLDQRKKEDIERYLREAEAARSLLEERQRQQERRSMKTRLERPPKPTR